MGGRAEQFATSVRESLRDDPLVALLCPITESIPDTGEFLAATFPVPSASCAAERTARLQGEYGFRRSVLMAKVTVLDELVRRLGEASIPFTDLFVGLPESSGDSSVTLRFGFF